MTENDERHLSRLIQDLGPVDPPDGFSRRVMTQISLEADRPRATVVRLRQGGLVMIKKAMWGLAAAAAIVLAVYSYTGFPPADRGTDGTVGAAQKYQAPQIAANDVKLGDAAAQEFLQSDAFEQLARDAEARELLSNARFARWLDDAEARGVVRNADARKALTSEAVHNLYQSPELRKELEDQLRAARAVRQATAETDARGARSVVSRVLADDQIRSGLSNNVVRKALDDENLRGVFANARMARGLNSAAFARAASHNGFAAAMHSDALARALRDR